jgi:hypothetical protein
MKRYLIVVTLILMAAALAPIGSPASAGEPQPLCPTPTPPGWDHSSLEFIGELCGPDFVGAVIKNVGDGDMMSPGTWWLLFSRWGNPKWGRVVAFGEFGPLMAGESVTITVTVTEVGNYMFHTLQAPGHPGNPNLWSEEIRGPCPTAVRLTSFDAHPAPRGVLLTWETATEHDNLGFNLYRSTTLGILGEQLNQDLIPSASPGGDEGAAYQFLDTTAVSGVTYYYTLEDVDYNGTRTPHGPVVFTLWRVYLPQLRR